LNYHFYCNHDIHTSLRDICSLFHNDIWKGIHNDFFKGSQKQEDNRFFIFVISVVMISSFGEASFLCKPQYIILVQLMQYDDIVLLVSSFEEITFLFMIWIRKLLLQQKKQRNRHSDSSCKSKWWSWDIVSSFEEVTFLFKLLTSKLLFQRWKQ
jgi:hypothetical protein